MTADEYREFKLNANPKKITLIKSTYEKNGRKTFPKTPTMVETEEVDVEFYNNYIQSIPFFDNWPGGGTCHAHTEVTPYGRIPARIVTVSPYELTKIIAVFQFE